MDPDQHPPRRLPAPRAGGRDAGGEAGYEAGYPFVPAPRRAPAIESSPARATTPTERPVSTAALVLAPRPSTALAVREPGVAGLLRSWARAAVRAAHVALDGARSLLDALVPAPVSR